MNSAFKTYYIPDEMCRRAGMSGRFLSSNELAVFPSQFVRPSSIDAHTSYISETRARIYQVRPEVMLFHPILRRMLNETSGIFVKLQSCSKNQFSTQEIVQYSIQYRSVIRACLENLKEEVLRTNGPENEEIQNYVTIFYSIECIWHLCEILFIQENTGSIIGTRLLEWVRFHIPKHERAATRMLQEYDAAVDSRAEYWPTIIGCLLHGRLDEVHLLLAMHTNANTRPFRAAEASLRSMPTHASHGVGLPLSEFNLRRKHWLVDTQSKLDGLVFAGEPQLHFIMRLLVGEEVAWNEARKHCEAWYELLAAWLFFTDPMLRTFELPRYARKCMRRMGVTMKHIDAILLAAMETDVEFLKQIQGMNENGWFITHLVDLLFHAQQLEVWKSNETTSAQLRESFLLEYGTLLMEHSSLWQIGLIYFDHCPVQGRAAIELLLPRAARNQVKTMKVIREASKRGLHHIVQSLSKIQCLQNMNLDRSGNALVWALKSQDAEYISHIVNHLLKQYKTTYQLPNEDLLGNLGSCMLASDSLIFLGKYYDYRSLIDNKRYAEAANTLVGLIGSKFTPRFFWDVILTETLRLLECKESIIDRNASMIILNHLDDRASQAELQDKLTMIRMALARNVSAAYTQHPQV